MTSWPTLPRSHPSKVPCPELGSDPVFCLTFPTSQLGSQLICWPGASSGWVILAIHLPCPKLTIVKLNPTPAHTHTHPLLALGRPLVPFHPKLTINTYISAPLLPGVEMVIRALSRIIRNEAKLRSLSMTIRGDITPGGGGVVN